MNRIATIDEVIQRLGSRDARQDWWIDAKKIIEQGRYERILARLGNHSMDIDFCEQCAIISAAIAEHWKNLGEKNYDHKFANEKEYVRCGQRQETLGVIEYKEDSKQILAETHDEEPLAIRGQGTSQTRIMPNDV